MSYNFFPPEISKLFKELGCESQFEFWWVFPESKNRPLLMYGQWEAAYSLSNHGYYHKAFHISDILCNKQNAILVFGEEDVCEKCGDKEIHKYPTTAWQFHIHHLLDLYNSGGEWENYVKKFLIK